MDYNCSRRTSRWLVGFVFSGLVTGAACAQAPPQVAKGPTPAAGKPVVSMLGTLEPPDKVVLKVGDQQFTKADVDFLVSNLPPQAQRDIATRGKKSLGDQYALIVMLARQAQTHHLDQSPDFVRRLAFQKQQMEAQEEMNQRTKLTPEEEQKYYTEHAAEFDEVMVRQIIARKKPAEPKADPAHPTPSAGPGMTPEEAKTRAEAIRKELVAGTDIKKIIEDFKPSGDVVIESEPRKVRRGSMRPELERVAFALKDGEVSEPIDIPQATIVFQVTGHSHLDFKDVIPDVERYLRQQKIDAALAEVKKNNTVWMDDQYFAAPLRIQDGPTLGPPPAQAPPKP